MFDSLVENAKTPCVRADEKIRRRAGMFSEPLEKRL
jgi:hypothetical protein